jgi:two-component system chemotaxis response regulator CheY
VLVNRQFARLGGLGVELIERMKADPQLAAIPVMLLSDYPDAQQEAVAAGADPGFGKSDLASDSTRQKLARFLGQ